MSKNTSAQKSAKSTKAPSVLHWDRDILPLLEQYPPTTGFIHGEQRAFYQVKGPGAHRLYIGYGKPWVNRIDIAMEVPDDLPLSSRIPVRAPNGSVTCELDPSHPEVLDDLRLLLLYMADPSTPPVQRKARTAFVPRMPTTAQLLPRGSAASRRALLEDAARVNGVGISAAAEAELREMEEAEARLAMASEAPVASTPGPNVTDWDAVASVLD